MPLSIADYQSSLRAKLDERVSYNGVERPTADCYCDGIFQYKKTLPEDTECTQRLFVLPAARIREYRERTGHLVGLKPAGGIRTARDSLDWLALVKDELGDRWLRPDLFRFGASALLTDIERQLEHFVTGRYSAGYRHPMA